MDFGILGGEFDVRICSQSVVARNEAISELYKSMNLCNFGTCQPHAVNNWHRVLMIVLCRDGFVPRHDEWRGLFKSSDLKSSKSLN